MLLSSKINCCTEPFHSVGCDLEDFSMWWLQVCCCWGANIHVPGASVAFPWASQGAETANNILIIWEILKGKWPSEWNCPLAMLLTTRLLLAPVAPTFSLFWRRPFAPYFLDLMVYVSFPALLPVCSVTFGTYLPPLFPVSICLTITEP